MKTMKTQRAVLPLAFLSAAFMLGCQDQASSPVEPDGLAPAFRHGGPPPHPPKEPGGGGDESGGKALLFNAASGFDCDDGAVPTGDPVGNVSWTKVFVGDAANGADHVHYKVNLQDAEPGTYEIRGNQQQACPGGIVDFVLGRFDRGNDITVKQNRQGSARGQLNFPVHAVPIGAEALATRVWVTVVEKDNQENKVFRSAAVTVVLPPHAEVGP